MLLLLAETDLWALGGAGLDWKLQFQVAANWSVSAASSASGLLLGLLKRLLQACIPPRPSQGCC